MSIEALVWAKRTKFGSSTRKLVMLVVADYADEAWSCWPSQARIADEAELGERSVRRVLGELEAEGWLVRERRHRGDGSRTSDRLVIVHDRPATAAVSASESPPTPDGLPANVTGPTGQPRPHLPATVAGQEPAVEPAGDPSGVLSSSAQLTLVRDPSPPAEIDTAPPPPGVVLGGDRDVWFAEFWNTYPRKTDKGHARKAWASARKRGTPAETIVRGAQRYAAERAGADPAYTAYPATWLNGERWDDDPAPVPQATPAAAGPARTAAGRTMATMRRVMEKSRDDSGRQLPMTTAGGAPA